MRAERGLVVLVLLVAGTAGCLQSDDEPSDPGPASEGGPEITRPAPRVVQTASPAVTEPVCAAVVHGISLFNATIEDLGSAMAEGRLTSVELVDAYIARFDALDEEGPAVNAVIEIHATAREQAAAMDAERAAGIVRGPMHGMPVLLKDNVGTDDQVTAAGSIALEKNIPPADATLVAKLREGGAVILGKAGLSEFANWVSLTMPNGYSSRGGQVVNAYTGGDPSGSSSGSGVAASMAMAAATVGTETSGSILSPSNANSVVGLKPTVGLVSRAGVIPLAANFDTAGPMVRHVYDAAAMMSAMAGPDPLDPRSGGAGDALPPDGDFTALLTTDALEGVRLGYDQESDDPLFLQQLPILESLGAELVPIDPSELTFVSILEIPLVFQEFKHGINRYLAEEAGPDTEVSDLTEIILYNQQHPDKVRYGQDLLIISDLMPGVGPEVEVAGTAVIMLAQAMADQMFADNGVDAVIGHNAPYTSLGAAAGYPTVTVPAGYDGVDPEGLSFFGPAWSDATLLSYAYAYEQATLARLPPHEVNRGLMEGVCSAGPPGGDEPALVTGNPRPGATLIT